ncbi:hypothetical protein [Mycobacterium servetii]|uniref:Uncharacterized protein n=1 Tax=Mycobacterium servetii TaxID=3237418 RepID=A0ABV4C1X4_9MYCO
MTLPQPPLVAAEALVRMPYEVANGYLYGQATITAQLPAPTGYSSAYVNLPVGGCCRPPVRSR